MNRNERTEARWLLAEARRKQLAPPAHKTGKSLLRWLRKLLRSMQ